jgi:hypothetical protein
MSESVTDPAQYSSWTAIANAIKAVASQNAKSGGPDVNSQISSARFDRFLSRVFADGPEPEWLLNGGTSMLARVPRSRATTDIDLAARGRSLDDAVGALAQYAQRDLGDHPSYPYRLFPIVDQVADKVCATMATNYPGGKPSSRVKDLVDLVVIARTQQVDLDPLRTAITSKRVLSRLKPFERFKIPGGWDTRYRALAAKTDATGGMIDVTEAEAFVCQFIDPALTPEGGPAATWMPGVGWKSPEQVDAATTRAPNRPNRRLPQGMPDPG